MNPSDWEKIKVQGLISLGAPWQSLAKRLRDKGITLLGFGLEALEREKMLQCGINATSSVQAVILHLPHPRVVWLLGTDENSFLQASRLLAGLLETGSLVLDGSAQAWEQPQHIRTCFEAAGILYLGPRQVTDLLGLSS
ncbi:MAG: hypothetical protein RI973_397 [Bacteroidota bacterium]|jgi:6-phosphogluconate dehydrogenase